MKRRIAKLLCMLMVLVMVAMTGCNGGKGGKGGNAETDAGFVTEEKGTFLDILESQKYTIAAKLEVEGIAVDLEARINESEFQIAAEANIEGLEQKIDAILGLSDEEIQVALPFVSDTYFVYNFVNAKDGFLAESAGMIDLDLEQIDSMLQALLSSKAGEAATDEIVTVVKEAVESWRQDEITATYEIDGSEKECTGWKYEISGHDFVELIRDMLTAYLDNYKEILDIAGVSADDVMDLFMEELGEEGLDETISLAVYTYDDKFAALVLEAADETVEVRATTMETTIPGFEIVQDGEVVGALTARKEGSTEFYGITTEDESMEFVEYTPKTGELVIRNPEDADEYIKCTIKCDGDGFLFSLDELRGVADMPENFKFEISVTKGAKIEKLDGKKVDIGNASMEELIEAVEPFIEYFEEISSMVNSLSENTLGVY